MAGTNRQLIRGGPAAARPAGAPGRDGSVADETLVRRCVDEGSQEAFTLLFQRHHRGILNYIYRMTGNYERAMELTQEVFVKAYQALHRFNPHYRFTTWIYHIASNRTIDHLRKRRPRQVPLGADDAPPAPAALRSRTPSPYEEVRARELDRAIHRAIEELPPSYRDLIVLRHVNQLRYDEIARIRRLPIGTVKNRIFRAREMLRRTIR